MDLLGWVVAFVGEFWLFWVGVVLLLDVCGAVGCWVFWVVIVWLRLVCVSCVLCWFPVTRVFVVLFGSWLFVLLGLVVDTNLGCRFACWGVYVILDCFVLMRVVVVCGLAWFGFDVDCWVWFYG